MVGWMLCVTLLLCLSLFIVSVMLCFELGRFAYVVYFGIQCRSGFDSRVAASSLEPTRLSLRSRYVSLAS